MIPDRRSFRQNLSCFSTESVRELIVSGQVELQTEHGSFFIEFLRGLVDYGQGEFQTESDLFLNRILKETY